MNNCGKSLIEKGFTIPGGDDITFPDNDNKLKNKNNTLTNNDNTLSEDSNNLTKRKRGRGIIFDGHVARAPS